MSHEREGFVNKSRKETNFFQTINVCRICSLVMGFGLCPKLDPVSNPSLCPP